MRLAIKRADYLVAINVLSMVLIVWLVLVGFDGLNDFLQRLHDVGKGRMTITGVLAYLAWTMPQRLYDLFINGALIGALLGIGGLATTGELVALRAAGMSKWRIVCSVLLTLSVMIAVVMLLGETLAPYATRQAHVLRARNTQSLQVNTRTGLWTRDGNHVINAKRVLAVSRHGEESMQLVDVRIFQLSEKGELTQLTQAEKAVSDGHGWTLKKVRISDITDQRIKSRVLASKPWQTRMDVQVLKQSAISPQDLSMRSLYHNMRYLTRNGQNGITYAKAFWEKAFFPINVLILVLCALPFCFGALRSGGLGKRIFIGVIVALMWHFMQQGLTNVGVVYGLAPWLADLLPAAILSLVAFVYFRVFG